MIDDIECSDEETYFPSGQSFRCLPATGERIWEPSGAEIVKLYEEIESKGYNELEWQNPGRISPSLLTAAAENEANQKKTAEEKIDSSSDQKTAFDDFDFDDPFGGGGGGQTKLNAKRSQHGQKKAVTTNLSKVMANIRRYKDPKGQPIAIKSNKPPSSSSSSITSTTTPTSLSSTSSAKVDTKTTTPITITTTTNNINHNNL